jgi:hypothetical protein
MKNEIFWDVVPCGFIIIIIIIIIIESRNILLRHIL